MILIESLVKLEKPEDVQAAFKEKGVELSLDEINKIKTLMGKINEDSSELSDNELDNIVGGFDIGKFVVDAATALADLFRKHRIKW